MIEIRQGSKKENGLESTSESATERKADKIKVPETGIEENKSACQPKNFRQIGTPQGYQKVYFEDYVYTYLHPIIESAEETRICILVGTVKKDSNCHYIFVNGAMELPEIHFAGVVPIFSEKTRESICALIQKNFEGSYLVGWYLDVKGNPPKLSLELERIHRNFFGGRDKVLLLSDSLNREEKIFACDGNAIWQEEGYYIYYEKNIKMQEYMIRSREHTQNTIEPEKVVDEALKNYRELILQKENDHPRNWRLAWYTTGFLLLLTVCVLGVNMLNNYEKMKKIESAITVMANRAEPATEAVTETEETETPVIIESVQSNLNKQSTENPAATQQQASTQAAQTSAQPAAQPETQAAAQPETQAAAQPAAPSTKTQQASAPAATQPAASPATETQSAAPALSEADTIKLQGYYIVQKGDNLAAVSRKIYGTTDKMKDICKKNNIENSDQIYAGQKLMLP